jgi:hypothetical protein
MWSKLRFSIITTTTCSIPDSDGEGSVASALACAASSSLPSTDPATAAPDAPATPRRKSLRLNTMTNLLKVLVWNRFGVEPRFDAGWADFGKLKDC